MDAYYDNKALADYLLFAPPRAVNTCVFCGNSENTFEFKGKIVCEECVDFVKDYY